MTAAAQNEGYYAVIFTSIRTEGDNDYNQTGHDIEHIAKTQPGYLGIEHFENEATKMRMTISYWKTVDDIKKWKQNAQHLIAQQKGKDIWYKYYTVRIAKIERGYQFHSRM